jgi:PBP1b-binding outer membrane lipoprotein LpoB
MMRIFLLFSLLFFAGCATTKPRVEYVDRPVEVFKEVQKPCLKKEQIPKTVELALDKVDTSGPFARTETIKAARIDRLVMKSYVDETQKLLSLCSD